MTETVQDGPTRRGLGLLRAGRRAFNHARYLMSVGADDEAEAKARAALPTLRSAMNWLEDGPYFEQAHTQIDQAGRFVRETFGCPLLFEDGTYYQTCPVALAHNRIGLSPGTVIKKSECSICRHPPDTCEHISGRMYDGKVCHRIITEAGLLEVSLVYRPRQPDARIMKISIDTAKIRRKAPEDWQPGDLVQCDNCLSDCGGVYDPANATATQMLDEEEETTGL
jgi:hypothetical protein